MERSAYPFERHRLGLNLCLYWRLITSVCCTVECSLALVWRWTERHWSNKPPLLSLPGWLPTLHWESLPQTLIQGLSHWLTGALPCRPKEGCITWVGWVTDVVFLSGLVGCADRLWKANWHLLLRRWPVAPSTSTVIIIIWPCWSLIWTSWPCSVIISNWHIQKRTGHPS